MFLEDLLAGLSGGLRGFGQAYSFEETDRKNRDERDQLRRDRLNQQGVEQMYRDYDIQENARRYGEQQKQARAGVAASQLAPNQAIDDLTYSFLQGTPYEARVQSTETLPSRGNYSMMGGTDLVDPGGELSRTWRPTWAESRALAEEGARSELLSDPSMARYAGRIRAGLGTSELPHERSAREAAGEQADTARALAVEDARRKSVLEEIRLRDTLSDNPGGGKSSKAEDLWKRYGAEYQSFVAQHGNKQKQRQDEATRLQKPDPLNPRKTTAAEVHYEEPLSFDQWLEQRKGIKPYGGGSAAAAIPVTPRASHTNTSAADAARVATPGQGPKVGQVVSAKGKTYRVGKVYPDGSWDPAPELARSH